MSDAVGRLVAPARSLRSPFPPEKPIVALWRLQTCFHLSFVTQHLISDFLELFKLTFSLYSQFLIFAISSSTETHEKTQKAWYCLSKKKKEEEGNELTTCAITALLHRAKKQDVCRRISAAEMNWQRWSLLPHHVPLKRKWTGVKGKGWLHFTLSGALHTKKEKKSLHCGVFYH